MNLKLLQLRQFQKFLGQYFEHLSRQNGSMKGSEILRLFLSICRLKDWTKKFQFIFLEEGPTKTIATNKRLWPPFFITECFSCIKQRCLLSPRPSYLKKWLSYGHFKSGEIFFKTFKHFIWPAKITIKNFWIVTDSPIKKLKY